MKVEQVRTLVAAAALAPNVHNVQPARWRLEVDGATLFEDTTRRLPVADPRAHDAAMSLGAAAEGLRLAASRAGLQATAEPAASEGRASQPRPVMRFRFEGGGLPDPLAEMVERRQSWRGAFLPADGEHWREAERLMAEDATVLTKPDLLHETARALDTASWGFMANRSFRRELLSWMRLSRRDPRWQRDGLNAEAMAMSGIEAWAAGLVLGPGFPVLRSIGLARPLLSEARKTMSAAAIVLFHRPAGEDPFLSGAHFYRLWLRIEQAGFGAAVLAALADDPETSAWISREAGLPAGHRLVSAFRIGRRPPDAVYSRARLPLDEIIIS